MLQFRQLGASLAFKRIRINWIMECRKVSVIPGWRHQSTFKSFQVRRYCNWQRREPRAVKYPMDARHGEWQGYINIMMVFLADNGCFSTILWILKINDGSSVYCCTRYRTYSSTVKYK